MKLIYWESSRVENGPKKEKMKQFILISFDKLQFGHLLFWSKNFVLDLVFRNWHWGNFPNTSLYLTIEGENSEVSTKK